MSVVPCESLGACPIDAYHDATGRERGSGTLEFGRVDLVWRAQAAEADHRDQVVVGQGFGPLLPRIEQGVDPARRQRVLESGRGQAASFSRLAVGTRKRTGRGHPLGRRSGSTRMSDSTISRWPSMLCAQNHGDVPVAISSRTPPWRKAAQNFEYGLDSLTGNELVVEVAGLRIRRSGLRRLGRPRVAGKGDIWPVFPRWARDPTTIRRWVHR